MTIHAKATIVRDLAKQIELDGWDYPQHLKGRSFSVVVHGDVEGAEGVRRSVADWLKFMGLIPAGARAELDRYIGYWQPYATSHDELDADRHRRMTLNAQRLREHGHLRAGVTLGQAADVLWTYSAPELYELLVIRQRWHLERYGEFTADAMVDALL